MAHLFFFISTMKTAYTFFLLVLVTFPSMVMSQPDILRISKTDNFEINGEGSHEAWNAVDWVSLDMRGDGPAQNTRVKVLYSDTGIYFLFQCDDEVLTATLTEDFADLYNEDVVEVFLWTEEEYPFILNMSFPRSTTSYPSWSPTVKAISLVGFPGTTMANVVPGTKPPSEVVINKVGPVLFNGSVSFLFHTHS